MQTPPQTNWLLYCRPGFERDCVQETQAKQVEALPDSGFVVVQGKPHLSYAQLTFVRQLIRLHGSVDNLPERDRITPLLSAIPDTPQKFSMLWLEVPDTNEGKELSGFTRRFQPLLEAALIKAGRLIPSPLAGEGQGERGNAAQHAATKSTNAPLPRLHIFFPDKKRALIGSSDSHNSASALMGIVRQSMPAEAPSRSTLKLAEAIEVFMDRSEQARLLRQGMTAVDLGAAPGGWTWQMVRRGIRVTAVDNGPMKGVLARHPLVEHLKQDGFKYAPRKAVDWLVCDMVEKPAKVAKLIEDWFAAGWCKHAIFNLKLPMKQRVAALDSALSGIRKRLDEEGINYRMLAKQLYHDREEVTVFLTRVKR